ncbi:cation diffusion facilitator family transporter [Desnuesiella massiliensis]|uniref:cation diffusion facilitator family transporter n=1 Tax=Desnuesiella massiliensis TaxID=1650662 RepID=UPI0006E136CB|nr:cation diffusion facilitator family transporter [Desnuesiella massiliensis]
MEYTNLKRVRNVLLIILVANVFVAVLKIFIGSLIKSASLSADGFHSLSDGSSNVVGLIGIWYAARPVDEDHPYGHRKFETLAGIFIGAMLTFVGINVLIGAFQRFFDPKILAITLESILALIVTLGVNIFVSIFEFKEGKRLNSTILVSDSLHTRSDIYVSLGVLITLLSIHFGLPSIIDPIASIVVALFIFNAAFEIFKENSEVLLDKAVVDAERIREIVLRFPQVKDIHEIRSRGRMDEVYIDLHIMVEPNNTIEESHSLMHNIENEMRKEICENTQVIMHIEPYYYLEKVD